jgi:hypothetical protein
MEMIIAVVTEREAVMKSVAKSGMTKSTMPSTHPAVPHPAMAHPAPAMHSRCTQGRTDGNGYHRGHCDCDPARHTDSPLIA